MWTLFELLPFWQVPLLGVIGIWAYHAPKALGGLLAVFCAIVFASRLVNGSW